LRLKDRVALVTGASRGIGRATAMALAREGAKVALNYNRSGELAEDVLRLIRQAGGEAEMFRGDAGDSEQMRGVFQQTIAHFGRLDIYVNNALAGKPLPKNPEDWSYLTITEEQLYEGFYPSFKAAFFNGQLAARQMVAQGSGGVIINITSVHQYRAWRADSLYGSMKAAVSRLTMSQGLELAPYGIRAVAIAPGFIDNRLYPGERGELYDWMADEQVFKEVPLGRGTPSDIAEAIVFLASDDARYITGTTILIDGGMLVPPRATV